VFDQPRHAQGCRGVAYWEAANPEPGAPCQKRVFKGYNNTDVFAVDADTGKACMDFGAGKGHPGYVSGMDYENYGKEIVHSGMKSPPTVIGDILVVASAATDSVVDASDGTIRGYDIRTGELKWTFDPIPAGHEHDTGAANAWAPLSIDAERGLVFVPTTAASPDLWGGTRLFDIPYEDSTIALKAETGEPVWHFQTIHHDIFDYDLPAQPMAVTIHKDGKDMPVVIQQTKLGFVFVFDRDTGKPVFPIEERPVPKSDMEGEQASPTQPFPVLPDQFGRTKLTEDDIWGVTPIDKAWCMKQFKSMRYDGVFTPPSERGTILYPWTGGAGNWGGAAYDPKNNLLIVKSINVAQYTKVIKIDPNEKNYVPKALVSYVTQGAPYRIEYDVFRSPLGIPCTRPPWGMLTAIDMDSGKIKWQIPYGQSRRFGINVPAFLKWGSPVWGGPMVTASGLIFISGAMDQKFRALDVATGKEVWETTLGPGGAAAVPMTYMANGKQYVVIAAGGATMEEMNRGAHLHDTESIVAYTLDEK
jgi:quinoprotein glucose dehydrogenase